MVLGVGVDYALFIVTRHRRNLRRGMSVQDSIVAAINTSGRAVLFAGTTVCIAMLGLTALGVSFFYGMAVGTAIAVSLTMLASLTLLPALLSFLGLRVLRRKQRRAVRAGKFVGVETVGFWARWSQLVARRRVVLGVVARPSCGAGDSVLLPAPRRHADQGNDPSRHHDPDRLRPDRREFRRRLQLDADAVVDGPRGPAPRHRPSAAALAASPGVDKHSIFVRRQAADRSRRWSSVQVDSRHRK